MKKLILTFLLLALWVVPAFATEKILYPNANGTNQDFSPNTGTDHYVLVDDPCASPDSDVTYLYKLSDGEGYYIETEGLDNCSSGGADSIPDNAVFDSVKIHIGKKNATPSDAPLWAYIRWTDQAEYIVSGAGSSYSYTYYKSTRNMATLTKTILNGTEVGMKMDYCDVACGTLRLTQAHLHVYYQQPVAGKPLSEKKKRIIELMQGDDR